MFSHIFENLRSKKHRKYRCFCASEAQNHGIYDAFCLWKQKSRYLQCFCNTGIYAVFTMLQDVSFIICEKKAKTLYFTMFLLPERSKKLSTNGSGTAQNRPPKASYNFSISFPGPRRTAPPVTKASCRLQN